jgi:hypothetical protein
MNNIIEAYHGALKRGVQPLRGFQGMRADYATSKGIEVLRMIRRGHCILQASGATGETRFVNKHFGLATSGIDSSWVRLALSKSMQQSRHVPFRCEASV